MGVTAPLLLETADAFASAGLRDAGYIYINTDDGWLDFNRTAAHGMRLDIAAGTAVRFEPGQRREVQLIPVSGARRIFGFNAKVMGDL